MNNHEHKYECTDIPAYYACLCGKVRVYDRFTREYVEVMA